jgi:hypothetical protein
MLSRTLARMNEPSENPNEVPRLSTPTWQMELLVSGGVVIAVWQLLAALDAHVASALSPLKQTSDFAQIFYLYPYAAFLAAGIAFALHLAMRSMWIAVVGVISVYPGGIRWENYQVSAKTAERMRKHFAEPAQVLEKLDNHSTIVFALGISIASMMFGSLLLMTVIFGIVKLLHWGILSHWSEHQVFTLISLPPFSVFLLAQFIDTGLSRWIPQQSWLAIVARKIIVSSTRLFAPGAGGYLLTVLTTNFGRWIGTIGVSGLVVAAILLAGTRIAIKHEKRPTLQPLVIQMAAAELMYRDTRSLESLSSTPFIDSKFSTSPYLSVHIPFRLLHFKDLAERVCKSTFTTAIDVRAITCLRQGIDIKLDNQAMLCPLELFANPANGTYTLHCVMDVRHLIVGRHELRIEIPPRDAEEMPFVYTIPFWR